MDVRDETLTVRRTARYHVAGPPPGEARRAWMVLHGYGQRAADFAAHFAPMAEAGACIVAPEALSRFYLDGGSGPVGASWMTRADRDHEIADYLAYLDALAEALFGDAPPPLHVLGFSQGTATAARWAARRLEREQRVDRLTLWAGAVPPAVSLATLAATRLTLAVGTRDAYVPPERLTEEENRLDAAGLDYALLRFDGGHRLDDDALLRLAGGEA